MLLCGGVCIAVAVAGFYSKALFLGLCIFLLFIAGHIIFKCKKPQLIIAAIMVVIVALSTALTSLKIQKLNRYDGSIAFCRLTICEITYRSDEFLVADTEVIESDLLPKGTKLSVYLKPPELKVGSIVEADVKLSNLTESKFKANSYSKGIYLNGSLKNVKLQEDKDAVLNAVGNVREYIKDTLFSHLGYSEASTLCALLFGDKSYFTDEFYGNVKASGVSHVMVVSGMHLAIFIALITKIGDRLFYNKYVKALCIVTAVLFLTALCGFTMSMLRAGVTYLLMALALALNRESTPENTLGAALTLILLFSPFAIFSVSLQLSLLATFGILVVALPVIDFVTQRNLVTSRLVTACFTVIVMSLSALLLTLPVTVYVFGCVSMAAPVTTLLITFAVTINIWLAIAALSINLISPFIAEVVFVPCKIITAYINFVINKIGSLPFAVAKTPKIFTVFAVLLIVAVFWLLLACKKRINMIKLKEKREKIIKEGGKTLKWQ